MVSPQDSQIHSKIDSYLEIRNGMDVSASEFLESVDFDPSEAERQISIWMERHPNDFHVLDRNPIVLKIYGTVIYSRRR
ncbi:hypothetical protein IX51_03725 [uncultured archaeon]|nr:hypothetical protein IX51_03725 [uncultured archaeon]